MANPEHMRVLKRGVATWNKWRKAHREVIPDLNGADLFRADLIGADLNFAHLQEVNLIGADLMRAYLFEADLSGARLAESDLYEANLTKANLTRADLYDADFTKVQFADADLSRAKLWGTKFLAVDISSVRGLQLAVHNGPSHIDTQTFQLSQGKIPEIFLRGAGLSDEMISFFRTLHAKPIEFYSCFISYSHQDKAFARRVHDTLQGRGIRCWLDEHQLLPGQKIHVEVDRGIRIWDKVLLCCSEHSLTSWWVNNEIELAIQKEQQLWKERGHEVLALIPLNLDGYLFKPEWHNGWKGQITERLAADFKGWEHDNSIFEEQLERVLKALMTEDAGRETPPTPRL